jgi:protein involved in polysaccharide export with SLBB domain
MNKRRIICAMACWLVLAMAQTHLASAQQVRGITEGAMTVNPPKPGEQPVEGPQFLLRPGDTVEVRFFYNQELNEVVQIRPDGHISLHLAGDLNVGNLTISEATAKLETTYSKFLKTPGVSLQMRNLASQKVYVAGEVNHPGVVNVSGRISALEAVMEAGGIKHTGNTATLMLVRKSDEGTPSLRKLSMKMVNGRTSEAALMMLQPYDVILVPETKIARADRWVDQYIRQILPLSLSGGFSYLAGASLVP